MILQALVKYYEDLERQEKLPKQGWCQAKVSYGINLSTDGDIKNILWLKEERQAGKKQIWISQTMKVPAMLTRSSGVAANFLCDNSKYMLGIDKSGTGKRITECFEAAKEKHLKLLKNTSGEMAQAICAFFYKWNPEKAKENAAVLENWEEITDGGNLIFCMPKIKVPKWEERVLCHMHCIAQRALYLQILHEKQQDLQKKIWNFCGMRS